MTEQERWLKANRCPHCARRGQPACPYKVRARAGGGYRCGGFESRWWNDRIADFKEVVR